MNKTVKFVNEKSIEDIIKYIEESNTEMTRIIDMLKESRKEYGLKVQRIVEVLESAEGKRR